MSNVHPTIDRYEELGNNNRLGVYTFNVNFSNGGGTLPDRLSKPPEVQ